MYGMRIDARSLPLHMQEQVALSVLEQTAPIVPGHRDDYNVSEWAYRNGQEKRSEEIISIMMEIRTKVKGEQYELLTELISRVRRLCCAVTQEPLSGVPITSLVCHRSRRNLRREATAKSSTRECWKSRLRKRTRSVRCPIRNFLYFYMKSLDVVQTEIAEHVPLEIKTAS